MDKKIELLAPASSLKSVIAAVNSGCDAIYIGGKLFSARAYADSPDSEQLSRIIDLCHLRGVKVFITLNTLYKNSELNDVLQFAHFLYEAGADAFIVQDMGFLQLVKKHFPDIEIHASTQMTIHNTRAAIYFDKMDVDRVVLSRELSLEEIKDIADNTNCDIECFVHGALCVCYSGRCLMSSIFGGRSGNRGRCAQPCRMEYTLIKNDNAVKKGYLISPKDICTAEMTDKLADAGIYSFKIEGRMKSPEYVAQVVSSYRSAIDNDRLSQAEMTDLRQIFNRGGSFSNGYYTQFAGSDMLSFSPKSSGIKIGKVISASKNGCVIKADTPLHPGDGIEIWNKKRDNTGCAIEAEYGKGSEIKLKIYGEQNAPVYRSFDKQLNDRLKKIGDALTKRTAIDVSVTFCADSPVTLTVLLDTPVTVTGSIPQPAENRPLTPDEITNRLGKTGNTPFIFNFVETNMQDGLFLPAGELNQLRRSACEAVEEYMIAKSRRHAPLPQIEPVQHKLTKEQKLTVFIEDADMFDTVLPFKPYRIYIELNADTIDKIEKCTDIAHKNNIQIFAALPRIMRNDYAKQIDAMTDRLESSDIDGYLVRNYGIPKTNKQLMYDNCFNVTNSVSADFFSNICLSPELTCRELRPIAGDGREIVVYGHLPLMSTHQCPIGNSTERKGKFCPHKGSKDKYTLKDRTGAVLPILTHCRSCTAFILNNAPIYTAHKFKDILSIGAEFMRIDFTIEDCESIKRVMQAYTYAAESGENADTPDLRHTSGHYFRGVL